MLRMKATNCVLTLALLAACGGGDDDSSDVDHDADPNQPDADPNAPDGGPLSAQIFDHNHIDVEAISDGCLEQLTSGDFIFHYAHRSHGSQIIVGAESLAADLSDFQLDDSYCSAPGGGGGLAMWDGMVEDGDCGLVQQEDYWDSADAVDELRGLLEDNPTIRYTMWAWSFEISEQTEESVQRYLDTLDMLEGEFPGVRFIYMTGPMPASDFEALNRKARNEQIRDYAQTNGKLLYDFAALDVWSNGENYSEEVDGEDVPMEHPDFQVEEPGFEFTHTSESNCVQKARAFWGMMAALECE